MIRTVSSKSKLISTITITILPKTNGRNGYCSKIRSKSNQQLFSTLFPFATKINPTTNQIMTIEPIKGTPIESTVFASKEKTLEDLQHELLSKITNFEEERLDLLDTVQRDEDIQEISPINLGFDYALEEELVETSKADTIDYLMHLSENHQRPNHISFIVTDIKNISNEKLVELLQQNIGDEFESVSLKRTQDRTAAGKTTSILVSANLINTNNTDKRIYYERLTNFGILHGSTRSQITKVLGLKTVEIRIPDSVDYDLLKKELNKLFEYTTIDSGSIKIQLSEPIYNPFDLVEPKHNGKANITFSSHYDAISAIEILRYWTIDNHYAKPNLSRYIFADNSDSSILLKTLEQKQTNQQEDIEIMKKMVDLKEKIALLETNINNLIAMKKQSKSAFKINQITTPQLNQLYN